MILIKIIMTTFNMISKINREAVGVAVDDPGVDVEEVEEVEEVVVVAEVLLTTVVIEVITTTILIIITLKITTKIMIIRTITIMIISGKIFVVAAEAVDAVLEVEVADVVDAVVDEVIKMSIIINMIRMRPARHSPLKLFARFAKVQIISRNIAYMQKDKLIPF